MGLISASVGVIICLYLVCCRTEVSVKNKLLIYCGITMIKPCQKLLSSIKNGDLYLLGSKPARESYWSMRIRSGLLAP